MFTKPPKFSGVFLTPCPDKSFLLYKRKDKLTDVESQIKIIKNFAAKVIRHIRYIANHAKYKITTGIIEGINNKIKNIKRRAYGIKNLQYLKLLAIDAFY